MGNTATQTIIKLSFVIILLYSCSGSKPESIGLNETFSTGKKRITLKPCPSTPNCITSFIHNNDESHFLHAIKSKLSTSESKKKIKQYISNNKNLKLINEEENYLYFEYTSQIMKFVDDVELYFVEDGILHFRSASRIGRKDFGANIKHIHEIRSLF